MTIHAATALDVAFTYRRCSNRRSRAATPICRSRPVPEPRRRISARAGEQGVRAVLHPHVGTQLTYTEGVRGGMYRPLGRLQHLAEGPRPASGEELGDELALDGAVAARGLLQRVDRRAERVLGGVAADLRRSPIRTHTPTRSWSPAGGIKPACARQLRFGRWQKARRG